QHMVAAMFASAAAAADPLNGASLYEDVKRYDSFGPHRYGSPGATRALDWIAEELAKAGLAVSSQSFTIGRQYDFESGALRVSGRTLSVVPHWWIPEQAASFRLTAPIASSGDAGGRFVRISLPFNPPAYPPPAPPPAPHQPFPPPPAALL